MCISVCLLFRGSPAHLSALLCQEAVSQLLQKDLSPFQIHQEAEGNQEEEQTDVCEFMWLSVALCYALRHISRSCLFPCQADIEQHDTVCRTFSDIQVMVYPKQMSKKGNWTCRLS